MPGWVKCERDWLDGELFANANLWHLWSYLLLTAAYQERWVTVRTGRGETVVHLLPGQLVFGRHSVAKKLGGQATSTWSRMLRLQALQKVIIESDTHYSVVTICNWPRYQCEEEADGQANGQATDRQPTGNRQATDRQLNTSEEGLKKGKKRTPPIIPPDVQAVLDKLHEVTGRRFYRPTKELLACVETAGPDDCCRVVEYLWSAWSGSTGQNGRPLRDLVDTMTPFRPGNFDRYLAKVNSGTVDAGQRRDAPANTTVSSENDFLDMIVRHTRKDTDGN